MSLRKHLPCAATLGNAGAGFVAIGLAAAGRPEVAALTILVAVLMDSLDGALARSMDAESEFGAELDSLADVVSFGVAPAMLAGSLLPGNGYATVWLLLAIYPLCAAWRLARYNTLHRDENADREAFVGLPTTGAGAAGAAAALLYLRFSPHSALVGPSLLVCVMLLLGFLMVSRFHYGHAGALISRLSPTLAVALAAVLVGASVLWDYEILFGLLIWGYVLSAPLRSAGHRIWAVRHA